MAKKRVVSFGSILPAGLLRRLRVRAARTGTKQHKILAAALRLYLSSAYRPKEKP